jgi:hypothetical protein
MRYPLSAAILAVVLAVCGFAASPTVATAGAASCSDSWGSDGHSGPWYTAPMTLHGNTVVISCPTSTTFWSVHYLVTKFNAGTGGFGYPIDKTRTGHGSISFSYSVNPVGCNPAPWVYWTHVHNNVTGGDIEKPPGGKTIC